MPSAIPATHGEIPVTRLTDTDTTLSVPSLEADGEADVHSRKGEVKNAGLTRTLSNEMSLTTKWVDTVPAPRTRLAVRTVSRFTKSERHTEVDMAPVFEVDSQALPRELWRAILSLSLLVPTAHSP